MVRAMCAILLVIGLFSPAWAISAGEVRLSTFREASADTRRGLVAGALALADKAGIVCEQPGTVAEYVAALLHRPLSLTTPWIDHLLTLMNERGCHEQEEVKPNA